MSEHTNLENQDIHKLGNVPINNNALILNTSDAKLIDVLKKKLKIKDIYAYKGLVEKSDEVIEYNNFYDLITKVNNTDISVIIDAKPKAQPGIDYFLRIGSLYWMNPNIILLNYNAKQDKLEIKKIHEMIEYYKNLENGLLSDNSVKAMKNLYYVSEIINNVFKHINNLKKCIENTIRGMNDMGTFENDLNQLTMYYQNIKVNDEYSNDLANIIENFMIIRDILNIHVFMEKSSYKQNLFTILEDKLDPQKLALIDASVLRNLLEQMVANLKDAKLLEIYRLSKKYNVSFTKDAFLTDAEKNEITSNNEYATTKLTKLDTELTKKTEEKQNIDTEIQTLEAPNETTTQIDGEENYVFRSSDVEFNDENETSKFKIIRDQLNSIEKSAELTAILNKSSDKLKTSTKDLEAAETKKERLIDEFIKTKNKPDKQLRKNTIAEEIKKLTSQSQSEINLQISTLEKQKTDIEKEFKDDTNIDAFNKQISELNENLNKLDDEEKKINTALATVQLDSSELTNLKTQLLENTNNRESKTNELEQIKLEITKIIDNEKKTLKLAPIIEQINQLQSSSQLILPQFQDQLNDLEIENSELDKEIELDDENIKLDESLGINKLKKYIEFLEKEHDEIEESLVKLNEKIDIQIESKKEKRDILRNELYSLNALKKTYEVFTEKPIKDKIEIFKDYNSFMENLSSEMKRKELIGNLDGKEKEFDYMKKMMLWYYDIYKDLKNPEVERAMNAEPLISESEEYVPLKKTLQLIYISNKIYGEDSKGQAPLSPITTSKAKKDCVIEFSSLSNQNSLNTPNIQESDKNLIPDIQEFFDVKTHGEAAQIIHDYIDHTLSKTTKTKGQEGGVKISAKEETKAAAEEADTVAAEAEKEETKAAEAEKEEIKAAVVAVEAEAAEVIIENPEAQKKETTEEVKIEAQAKQKETTEEADETVAVEEVAAEVIIENPEAQEATAEGKIKQPEATKDEKQTEPEVAKAEAEKIKQAGETEDETQTEAAAVAAVAVAALEVTAPVAEAEPVTPKEETQTTKEDDTQTKREIEAVVKYIDAQSRDVPSTNDKKGYALYRYAQLAIYISSDTSDTKQKIKDIGDIHIWYKIIKELEANQPGPRDPSDELYKDVQVTNDDLLKILTLTKSIQKGGKPVGELVEGPVVKPVEPVPEDYIQINKKLTRELDYADHIKAVEKHGTDRRSNIKDKLIVNDEETFKNDMKVFKLLKSARDTLKTLQNYKVIWHFVNPDKGKFTNSDFKDGLYDLNELFVNLTNKFMQKTKTKDKTIFGREKNTYKDHDKNLRILKMKFLIMYLYSQNNSQTVKYYYYLQNELNVPEEAVTEVVPDAVTKVAPEEALSEVVEEKVVSPAGGDNVGNKNSITRNVKWPSLIKQTGSIVTETIDSVPSKGGMPDDGTTNDICSIISTKYSVQTITYSYDDLNYFEKNNSIFEELYVKLNPEFTSPDTLAEDEKIKIKKIAVYVIAKFLELNGPKKYDDEPIIYNYVELFEQTFDNLNIFINKFETYGYNFLLNILKTDKKHYTASTMDKMFVDFHNFIVPQHFMCSEVSEMNEENKPTEWYIKWREILTSGMSDPIIYYDRFFKACVDKVKTHRLYDRLLAEKAIFKTISELDFDKDLKIFYDKNEKEKEKIWNNTIDQSKNITNILNKIQSGSSERLLVREQYPLLPNIETDIIYYDLLLNEKDIISKNSSKKDVFFSFANSIAKNADKIKKDYTNICDGDIKVEIKNIIDQLGLKLTTDIDYNIDYILYDIFMTEKDFKMITFKLIRALDTKPEIMKVIQNKTKTIIEDLKLLRYEQFYKNTELITKVKEFLSNLDRFIIGSKRGGGFFGNLTKSAKELTSKTIDAVKKTSKSVKNTMSGTSIEYDKEPDIPDKEKILKYLSLDDKIIIAINKILKKGEIDLNGSEAYIGNYINTISHINPMFNHYFGLAEEFIRNNNKTGLIKLQTTIKNLSDSYDFIDLISKTRNLTYSPIPLLGAAGFEEDDNDDDDYGNDNTGNANNSGNTSDEDDTDDGHEEKKTSLIDKYRKILSNIDRNYETVKQYDAKSKEIQDIEILKNILKDVFKNIKQAQTSSEPIIENPKPELTSEIEKVKTELLEMDTVASGLKTLLVTKGVSGDDIEKIEVAAKTSASTSTSTSSTSTASTSTNTPSNGSDSISSSTNTPSNGSDGTGTSKNPSVVVTTEVIKSEALTVPQIVKTTAEMPPTHTTPSKMPSMMMKVLDIKKMQNYLNDFKSFVNFLKTSKHTEWTKQLQNYVDTTKVKIQDNLAKHKTGDRHAGNRVALFYKNILYQFEDKASLNYKYNKDFFSKEGRRKVFELMNYLNQHEYIKNVPTDERFPQYDYIDKNFNGLLKEIEEANDKYYEDVREIFKTAIDETHFLVIPDREEQLNIKLRKEELEDTILSPMKGYTIKIKSLYRLNYNAMDIILDGQFFLLYVIKGIRILFSYIALFLATRVFSPMYENAVYDGKQNPPALWKFMIIYAGFDISFNAFLLVILYILKLLFKTPDNAFIIDNLLFNKYIIDYIVVMILLVFIGVLMSKVITNKKYFKYKYEGVRAIRAFESMIFSISIVLNVFPFFLMG